MIFLVCFLTIISLGRCMDQVPTRLEIETSINRTIDEVERLIKEEPSLPRLSRRQIVDILHNITSSDMDSYEESVEKARSDYQKALMVVLPYNSKDTHGEDLKDLYTRPPIVQVIPDSEGMFPFASIQEERPTTQSPLDNLISKKYSDEENKFESSEEDYKSIYDDQSDEQKPEKFTFNLQNINSTKPKSVTDKPKVEIIYSTSVTEKAKTTGRPIDQQGFRPTMPTTKSTANILSSDQWTYYAPPLTSTTPRPATSRRPSVPGSTLSTTKATRKPSTVTTTNRPTTLSTTRRPTTLSTTVSTTTTARTTPPMTTRRPTTVSTTTTRRPASTTTSTPSTTQHTTRAQKPSQIQNKPAPFLPTVISKTSSEELYPPLKKTSEEVYPPFKKLPATTTTKKPRDMSSLEILGDYPTSAPKLSEKKLTPLFKKLPTTTTVEPEAMKFDLSSMTIMEKEKPARPIYVTPMESVKNIPRPTPELPKIASGVREEIANLLATIGLRPIKGSSELKSKPSTLSNEVSFTKDYSIPESNSVYTRYTGGITSGEIVSPSIIGQNTFNNGPNDLRFSASNLTPDVQQLLQRFGLQLPASKENKSTTTTTATTTTTTTTSKPTTTVRSIPQKNSWNMFIPVPTSVVKDESMKDFLAKFGLGVPETRQEKSMKKSSRSSMSSVIDVVPNNMKDILENIGLITRPKSPPKPKTQTTTTTTEEPEKLHIFKPHESLVDDAKQRVRINQLLDTVKLVQEGKADVSDVRRAANELLKHTKTLPGGSDLLSLEEILKNYNEDTKNEVKRQELQAMADSMDMASSESEVSLMPVPSKDSDDLNSTRIKLDIPSLPSDSAGTSSDDEAKIVTSGLGSPTEPTSTTPSGPTEGPNIDDLVDSFGGSTAEPDPVLPTPRKSGLYFLVDWNSFLEVGEDGKDKVNLRFSPKVGDKSRFIPVVVP